ncbi:MAG: hypothetical protein AAFO03_08165 [Bacteroidota bacterium]
MYAIAKPLVIIEASGLSRTRDIFYCDEETGDPFLFEFITDADDFRDKSQLDGQIVELPISMT